MARRVERLRAAGLGGDVGGDLDDLHAGLVADGLRGGGERGGAAGNQHEVDAFAREGFGAAAAEALAGGAHEGGLAAESEIHAVSLRGGVRILRRPDYLPGS